MANVELLLDCRARIGESPTWFAVSGALLWIDVKEPALHWLGADGQHRGWPLESDIGAFALLEGGVGAVVALRSGIFRLQFSTGTTSLLAETPFDPKLFRFNEGICDERGRFWVGVMFDPQPGVMASGSPKRPLHRFTLSEGLVAAADDSDLHNGFAWSPDSRNFLYSHSRERRVYRVPYELTTGVIGKPQLYVEVGGRSDHVPDGAAMDEEGCYWCAIHGGGVIHRYDAASHLLSQVALPVSQPTMCAFVGRELDEMVVTSARDKLTQEQLAREPHAGGVFRFRPGVRGLPRPCVVQ